MKNHLVFKFLAILICSLTLLAALASTAALVTFAAMGINDDYTVDEAYKNETSGLYEWTAYSIAQRYASRALGGCSEEFIRAFYGEREFSSSFRPSRVFYTVQDDLGHLLATTVPDRDDLTEYPVKIASARYVKLLSADSPVHVISVPEMASASRADAEEDETMTEDVEQAADVFSAADEEGGTVTYRYVRENSPKYIVTLYLAPNPLVNDQGWNTLRMAWNYRTQLIVLLGISLLMFAVSAVYLCTVAGRAYGSTQVMPMGLNRTPIDLYAVITLGVVAAMAAVVAQMSEYLASRDFQVMLACMLYGSFAACLVFVGFCYCFVAQVKTPNWYIWKNSLCGRVFAAALKALRWSWHNLPNVIKSVFLGMYHLTLRIFRAGIIFLRWILHEVKRPLAWIWGKLHGFLRLLPLIWQWLLVAGILGFAMILMIAAESFLGLFVVIVCAIAVFVYGAWSFGVLLEGARRMHSGNLDNKVDEKYMVAGFRDFAQELNGLADVAVVAAQKQLKSERMKTELITNVSHDIKTPLTSIINYVDLLKKPHNEQEQAQYLEVLDRQSHRMKKLIDDLIEMSKAASGNMTVEIIPMDAAEVVNQALGEFSDKMEKAGLIPVFHHPEEPLILLADGKLLWRAMSNILSNAVKYALPGTRLYIDLSELEGKVVISFKNISREQLNIGAEELMERFVRGDASRNTEGSGLGLNIARSMMELQHGQLQLLVDGDLFKVTLVFPKESK